MTGAPAFEARDLAAPTRKLETWGATAPHRLRRRGQQKLLERWCLNRFLTKRGAGGHILFPLKVWESENPDFFLEEAGTKYGLEVTEAVDWEEQARISFEARAFEDSSETGPCIRGLTDEETSGKRYAGFVGRALRNKQNRCSRACNQILIYLNTMDSFWEAPIDILEKLSSVPVRGVSFQKIWVLDGGSLFELKDPRLIFANSDQ